MSSGDALLTTISALPQLDTLVLLHVEGLAWPGPSAAVWSGLVGTKLQKLVVDDCVSRLPDGVWEHVFATCQLLSRVARCQV